MRSPFHKVKGELNKVTTVYLKKGKEEPVKRKHPWVFSGAIHHLDKEVKDGELVQVADSKGNFLGSGHFHHGSIAVRLLSFEESLNPMEAPFWEARLQNAKQVRSACGIPKPGETTAYRLIHGEGDGLSGLVIDIYGSTAVVQCHSIGMHLQVGLIRDALVHVFGSALTRIYDKSVESLPGNYAKTIQNGVIWSTGDSVESAVVLENGVRFKVDWVTGQKTGFFLDQRDNRQLLASYVSGKTVLNTFCYSGGFSCYALMAGAKLVHSVDVSARAMELTAENVELNTPFTGVHEGFTADVPLFLKNTDQKYEVIVVDPPAFAKSMDKRHNAVQGYKRLNIAALQKVEPGGILFTFSCSQVIDRELFYNTIAAAAIEAGRNVRVLHHLTQGPDHPVSMFHPEGAYLKGLVLHVG